MKSKASSNATSSAESSDGPSPLIWEDGPETEKSGLGALRVNHGLLPEISLEKKTNAISGPNFYV